MRKAVPMTSVATTRSGAAAAGAAARAQASQAADAGEWVQIIMGGYLRPFRRNPMPRMFQVRFKDDF
jgi:hypothetical protein